MMIESNSLIPPELEDMLYSISKNIPICIISSKDFYFLYEKIKKFSNILSCILGMETLFLGIATIINTTSLSLMDNKKIDTISLLHY